MAKLTYDQLEDLVFQLQTEVEALKSRRVDYDIVEQTKDQIFLNRKLGSGEYADQVYNVSGGAGGTVTVTNKNNPYDLLIDMEWKGRHYLLPAYEL